MSPVPTAETLAQEVADTLHEALEVEPPEARKAVAWVFAAHGHHAGRSDLPPVLAVGGPNNCGKSTLLAHAAALAPEAVIRPANWLLASRTEDATEFLAAHGCPGAVALWNVQALKARSWCAQARKLFELLGELQKRVPLAVCLPLEEAESVAPTLLDPPVTTVRLHHRYHRRHDPKLPPRESLIKRAERDLFPDLEPLRRRIEKWARAGPLTVTRTVTDRAVCHCCWRLRRG